MIDENTKKIIEIELNDLQKQIIENWDRILDVNFDKEIRLRTHIITIKINVKESLILDS